MSRSKLFMSMAGIAAMIGIAACASVESAMGDKEKIPLQISTDIPAAKGTVEAVQGKNQVDLKVTVDQLAPAGEVIPGTNVYVVWLRLEEDPSRAFKLGILDPGTNRKAELKATTGFRRFDIVVTAEEDARVTEPSQQRMMAASVGATTF